MRWKLTQPITWICIACIMIGSIFLAPARQARSDFWGGDLALLSELIVKAVEQIEQLQQVISKAGQTVSILEDMNRGVKEVLRLADTAHVPLPQQVYENARTITRATEESRRIYGEPPGNSSFPAARTHYQSGTEGLFLSQDAFDYSRTLDRNGDRVKQSALSANPSSAARLTAETLGVVVHAISHTNRLQAKSLEISSTDRLEKSQGDAAKYDSFVRTHEALEKGFRSYEVNDLNAFSDADGATEMPSDLRHSGGTISGGSP